MQEGKNFKRKNVLDIRVDLRTTAYEADTLPTQQQRPVHIILLYIKTNTSSESTSFCVSQTLHKSSRGTPAPICHRRYINQEITKCNFPQQRNIIATAQDAPSYEKTCFFACAKIKAQISCTVTSQLISTHSTICKHVLSKSKISSL